MTLWLLSLSIPLLVDVLDLQRFDAVADAGVAR